MTNGRNLVRTILITNFLLLFLLVGPGNSRQLYLVENRLGIAHVIVFSFQFWLIASTILATVMFVRILSSRSEAWRTQRPTKLDWTLFLSWLLLVAIFCSFAFMTGMGGWSDRLYCSCK